MNAPFDFNHPSSILKRIDKLQPADRSRLEKQLAEGLAARTVVQRMAHAITFTHSREAHENISKIVDSLSFLWLCETAILPPHETRARFRKQLGRVDLIAQKGGCR